MTTFKETVFETFTVVSCYTCGVRFGIASDLYRRAVTNATGSVYCPSCGHQTCWRGSEAERKIKDLQQKLEWEAAEVARHRERRIAAEASLQATRGVVTRLKRRAAGGVCPCCNRTFKQLAAHMSTKHPKYGNDHAPAPTGGGR